MRDLIEKYRSRLRIDKNDLDRELVKQSVYVADVGIERAKANSRRELAKEEVAKVRADVWAKEETRLKRRADGRVTNVMIEARVEQDDLYQKTRAVYKEAQKEAEIWEALFEAFRGRGFSLRDLVQLELVKYYDAGEERQRLPGKRH